MFLFILTSEIQLSFYNLHKLKIIPANENGLKILIHFNLFKQNMEILKKITFMLFQSYVKLK